MTSGGKRRGSLDPARTLRARFGSAKRHRIAWILLSLLSAWLLPKRAGDAGPRFILTHAGFQILRQGEFENAGHNLYVSRQGRIQLINRWDLNNDGYYDLVFNTTHNRMDVVDTFVYLQKNGQFLSAIPPLYDSRPLYERWTAMEETTGQLLRLRALRPSAGHIQDLDEDGFPDLVLANTTDGFTQGSTSYLYWGSSDGYGNPTALPTAVAQDVCTGDLNGDGYPEIVFANRGQGKPELARPEQLHSFIYWGSRHGYSLNQRTLVAVRSAVSCAVTDLDGDGHEDLAIANANVGGAGLRVYWGNTTGPELDRPTRQRMAGIRRVRLQQVRPFGPVLVLNTDQQVGLYRGSKDRAIHEVLALSLGAWSVAASDLDGDEREDLVLATDDEGKILWSRENYSLAAASSLPALAPRGVAVADLNRDQQPEIILANSRSDKSFEVPSYVYWGNRWGYGPHRRLDLQTFEAADVSVGDVNLDGELDLLFANGSSAHVKGPDTRENSLVYWGLPHRGYSPSNVSGYPTNAAMGSAMADLDDDGHSELLFANMDDTSFLYPGSPQGPSVKDIQRLSFSGSAPHNSLEINDINRDGYLDVLLCGRVESRSGGQTMILWGGPPGVSSANSTTIHYDLKGVANIRLADLNRDGWLDLFLAATYDTRSAILWGGAQGYSVDRLSFFEEPYIGTVEFADLDQDGYLDLILCKALDLTQYNVRAGSQVRIRFGGPRGFFQREPIELPAFTAIDASIADFNRDGHLDIAVAQYKGDLRADYPFVIFWNDGQAGFSTARRTDLPGLAGAGLLSADYDEDGWIDFLGVNHIANGNHNVSSYLYWGSPSGFSSKERTALPAPGPHWTQNVDIGNLLSRKLEEAYTAVPVKIPLPVRQVQLSSDASTPRRSRVEWQVRTARTKEELPLTTWRPLDPSWSFSLSPQRRWLQYRATLVAGRGGASPYLTRVTIQEVR